MHLLNNNQLLLEIKKDKNNQQPPVLYHLDLGKQFFHKLNYPLIKNYNILIVLNHYLNYIKYRSLNITQ
jgi:hypothetical protein